MLMPSAARGAEEVSFVPGFARGAGEVKGPRSLLLNPLGLPFISEIGCKAYLLTFSSGEVAARLHHVVPLKVLKSGIYIVLLIAVVACAILVLIGHPLLGNDLYQVARQSSAPQVALGVNADTIDPVLQKSVPSGLRWAMGGLRAGLWGPWGGQRMEGG